jgi:gas vesicle protein
MLRRRQNTGKKMALSALIAGAAGYVGGILTAPKSGRETRKQLKALKAGQADDPELNRAVKQARQAAKNLGKFFKS